MKPLPKIIDYIRRFARLAKIVMFKLEVGVSDAALIRRAKLSRDKNRVEIIVSNQLEPYRAFIIDKEDGIIRVKNKKELAKRLFEALGRIK